MPRDFDVIVLGASPAGEVAAGRPADGGLFPRSEVWLELLDGYAL